jgi:predicted RNA binding protein YcfA (HicA-like mRNA interferase family)
MSKVEKLIDLFLRKPTEVTFEDVVKIVEAFGYEEKPSGSGSHRVFIKKQNYPIVVPIHKGKMVKRVYIQMIIDRLGLEE